jgi:hypothetical protein
MRGCVADYSPLRNFSANSVSTLSFLTGVSSSDWVMLLAGLLAAVLEARPLVAGLPLADSGRCCSALPGCLRAAVLAWPAPGFPPCYWSSGLACRCCSSGLACFLGWLGGLACCLGWLGGPSLSVAGCVLAGWAVGGVAGRSAAPSRLSSKLPAASAVNNCPSVIAARVLYRFFCPVS